MAPRKTAQFFLAVTVASLVALVRLGTVFVPAHRSETMSDFAALWNTTDALQLYVATRKQWPRDWHALSSSFAHIDRAYSSGDVSLARERVQVNFTVEIGSPPRANEWYVQLTSGRMEPEQANANTRLRAVVKRASPH